MREEQPSQRSETLFDGAEGTLRVEASAREARRVSLRVGRRRVAELPADVAAQIGALDGAAWTQALAAAVDEAQRLDRARRRALTLLSKRATSRSRLIEALRRAGHDDNVAERTAADLERAGFLDDQSLARGLIEAELRRRPAGAARLVQKLLQRGLEERTAQDAVADALRDREPVVDARDAAERRLRALPPSLSPAAAARRLESHLARRGFDATTRREAIESILGTRFDDSGE